MPEKAKMYIQIPLEATYKGKPVALENGQHLRRLRAWIDECIRACDIAESLPDLSEDAPIFPTPDRVKAVRFPTRPEPGKTAYDYLLRAIREYGDVIDSGTALKRMLELGWKTDSPTEQKKKLNVESTARKHPETFIISRGYIQLRDNSNATNQTDSEPNLLTPSMAGAETH